MLTGSKRQTIYIAGPMTGIVDFNFPAFHAAAKAWDERGWAVLNPASSFDGRLDLYYTQYMRSALMLLLQADAIALLPGWQKSKGACMKALVAQQLGLPTFDAITYLPIPIQRLRVVRANGPKLPAFLKPVHLEVLTRLDKRGLCQPCCDRCGLTVDQLEQDMCLPHQSLSPRVWELAELGLIVRSGYSTPTRFGGTANRYILTPAGKARLT